MEFLIILLLLVLNGIFAMYEIALVSSSKARLETLAGKGNKSARGVLKQLEEPEKFLSTIQIGITLIGIVSGAYGGVAIADDLVPLFSLIPGAEAYARNLAMITTVVIITYLSLIIGELHLHPPAEQNHRRKERRTPHDTGGNQNDSPPKLRTGSDRQRRNGNAS